jgi:hypothetical protein
MDEIPAYHNHRSVGKPHRNLAKVLKRNERGHLQDSASKQSCDYRWSHRKLSFSILNPNAAQALGTARSLFNLI